MLEKMYLYHMFDFYSIQIKHSLDQGSSLRRFESILGALAMFMFFVQLLLFHYLFSMLPGLGYGCRVRVRV